MYASQYYGVESHPMSGIDFEGIKNVFNLGQNEDVVMLIALGYFDDTKQLYPQLKRKGYEEIVREV
jgi:nitroreductase